MSTNPADHIRIQNRIHKQIMQDQETEIDFHEAEDNKDDYFCHKRREE